ncbi:MAG: hypothetical protein ABR564_03005 [Candidatus Dormibacteria bacterium]
MTSTKGRRRPQPEPEPDSLIGQAARRLATTVADVVPADAVLHLVNAQREILLAVSTVVSHNISRSQDPPTRRAAARGRKPSRVDLD